jgi:microcystin degradation protein MlrC
MNRILLAGLFHETNTFLAGTTPLSVFEVRRGEELLQAEGDGSPLDGFIEVGRRHSWEILPTVDMRATPSATVADDAVTWFWEAFESRVRRFLKEGVDGAFFVLHGAMASESMEDVEGEILRRFRSLPGAAEIPLFGVFDLHANFSTMMARHADGLVAYRENPHIDARSAGVRAAELLARGLGSREKPMIRWRRIPVIWPATGTGTGDFPMRALEEQARSIEERDPGIWAVNIVSGFAYADTSDTGVSCSLVADRDSLSVDGYLEELAAVAWENRAAGLRTDEPLDDVLRRILPVEDGPVILIEPSDNIGGGAPGDGTGILRAFLDFQVDASLVAINDPEAVARTGALAPGDTVALSIGGKGSRLDTGPVELIVRLISRSGGTFDLEDRQSHLASMVGTTVHMGPCAVVKHEGITILLTTRKTPPFDLGQFHSQGIEPAQMKLIGVKAAVAHRRAYDPIARASYWVETPGPCSSDLRKLPYERVARPVFPLD